MDIEKVKQGLKLLDEGMRLLGAGPMDYYAQRLVGCYEFLLTLAPHQPGDRVRLIDTPVITERESWGWLGGKHFLVKGAIAVVHSVEANFDGFSYFLKFEDDSWINSYTKEVNPRPPKERDIYGFREKWIEKTPDSACPNNGSGNGIHFSNGEA
jgi:hypothetical protein